MIGGVPKVEGGGAWSSGGGGQKILTDFIFANQPGTLDVSGCKHTQGKIVWPQVLTIP